MESTFTPSDMIAMMNNGNNNWNNNPFIWLVFLYMFGNGGFGFGNNSTNNASTQGMVTRAELTDGFNNQNMQNDVRHVLQDINTSQFNTQSGINTVNSNIQNAMFGLQNSLNDGFNNLNNAINQNTFNNQMGFCNTNNNISSLKYEMAQNCNDLKNAMHFEGEATRAMIQNNLIQELRDKLADKNLELQNANNTIVNSNQTSSILSSLGRYVAYSGCGNTCGCNNW